MMRNSKRLHRNSIRAILASAAVVCLLLDGLRWPRANRASSSRSPGAHLGLQQLVLVR